MKTLKPFCALGMGLLLMALFGLVSCSKSVTVSRVANTQSVDLSGKWNDTDSRLVAQEMAQDSLRWPWITQWKQRYRRNPVVVAYGVTNRTSEHISTETFMKDLERSFLRSGKVDVVADSKQRETIRGERVQQNQGLTLNPAAIGRELGADFVLTGTINAINDREGNLQVVFYQTNLELINVTSSKKVWIGDKKIKKVLERSRFKF